MSLRLLLLATSTKVGLTYHLTRLSICLQKNGYHVCVLTEPRDQVPGLSDQLAEVGIKHYTSHYVDRLTVHDLSHSKSEIQEILKTEQIDLIHTQGAMQSLSCYLAQIKQAPGNRIPIVTSVHHIPMEGFTPPEWLKLVSALNICSNTVLPVSDDTRRRLTQHAVYPSKMSTVYNGIDIREFDYASKCEIGGNNFKTNVEPSVVCVANLVKRKGVHHYLVAAAKVLEKVSAKFYVVGAGPERNNLEVLANDLGIIRNIVFTGRISWPEMYSLLVKADVCVSCSLNELFPFYILECMAAGKPIVTTNVGGISEAVEEETNGYLVRPGNPSSVASAIYRLLANPDRAKEFGRNSRIIVTQKFNLSRTVENLTNCYSRTLTKSR
jgi:glycosyltransferase involved in cell wall biosynthesis